MTDRTVIARTIRRFLSALMIFSMTFLLFVPALAEDFVLRNDIQFGDTIETILEKETTLLRESNESRWFKGTIAGYNNAECGFYFNEDDGKLYAMDYSFNHMTSRDSTDDVYEKLHDSLVRKYGSSLGNRGGDCYLITGPAMDHMGLYVFFFGALDGYNSDYYDYDEWIVECGDYSVKIDLISYYYRDSDYNYNYYVDVSYKMFTDADLESERSAKQAENDAVDNDL